MGLWLFSATPLKAPTNRFIYFPRGSASPWCVFWFFFDIFWYGHRSTEAPVSHADSLPQALDCSVCECVRGLSGAVRRDQSDHLSLARHAGARHNRDVV